jgi:hypothetical protein
MFSFPGVRQPVPASPTSDQIGRELSPNGFARPSALFFTVVKGFAEQFPGADLQKTEAWQHATSLSN